MSLAAQAPCEIVQDADRKSQRLGITWGGPTPLTASEAQAGLALADAIGPDEPTDVSISHPDNYLVSVYGGVEPGDDPEIEPRKPFGDDRLKDMLVRMRAVPGDHTIIFFGAGLRLNDGVFTVNPPLQDEQAAFVAWVRSVANS